MNSYAIMARLGLVLVGSTLLLGAAVHATEGIGWQQLTPEQQAELREKLQRFRALPPEQQAKLRKLREWYRQQSPERQQRLKSRWRRAQENNRQKH